MATKEKWYQSRRVWGATLSALVAVGAVLMPEQYELWVALGAAGASALGITSWVKPKKV